MIVSLLDLHPTVPGDDRFPTSSDERLEIFEAGTGQGALTLNLARAIHAANSPPPSKEDINEYESWRQKRRAVVHTLDNEPRHSAHAKNVIRDFRKGIYYPQIDLHVGTIDDYLSSRLKEGSGKEFLDHVILDLPRSQDYLDIVSKSLKSGGKLITFCPSITQINEGVLHAKNNGMSLYLERVLEVGGWVGTGGREWDVRPVKPRALERIEAQKASEILEVKEASEEFSDDKSTSENEGKGWEMVCRPKVGGRVTGGGFIGVWTKLVTLEPQKSNKPE